MASCFNFFTLGSPDALVFSDKDNQTLANDVRISTYQWRRVVTQNFVGCVAWRKSSVGSVVMRSVLFLIAWSRNVGSSGLALKNSEPEPTAVVKAGTEGDLCGEVAVKSGATGEIRRLGLGTVRHLFDGGLVWVLSRSSVHNSSLQNFRTGESE